MRFLICCALFIFCGCGVMCELVVCNGMLRGVGFSAVEQILLSGIPGRVFDRSLREYLVPADSGVVKILVDSIPGLVVSGGVDKLICDRMRGRVWRGDSGGVVMPVRGTPYEHQREAFARCLTAFGVGL